MDFMKNANTEDSSRDYSHRGDFRVSLVVEPPFRAQVLHVLRSEFEDVTLVVAPKFKEFELQYDISRYALQ